MENRLNLLREVNKITQFSLFLPITIMNEEVNHITPFSINDQYTVHISLIYSSTWASRTLRYDTQGNFFNSSSWEAYDAMGTDGLVTDGYYGGVFDGTYIYYAQFYSGILLQYRAILPGATTGT